MQIAASLAVLDVPWVIKPLYGVISDFLPLFGYRRRSYLLLANVAAVAAFLWTTQVLTPAAIVFALLLTAIAMAVSSTVCGALLVENGQKHQRERQPSSTSSGCGSTSRSWWRRWPAAG